MQRAIAKCFAVVVTVAGMGAAHGRGLVIGRVVSAKRLIPLLQGATTRQRLPIRPRRAVGWGAGESQTYDVRIAGIDAARAALTVGRPRRRKGRWTITFRSIAETVPFISALYRLSENSLTLATLDRLQPLRTKERRVLGTKTRKMDTRHGALNHQLIERSDRRPERRKRRFPGPHFDPITSLYALRSVPLKPGQHFKLLVLAGTALYDVRLTVMPKERLRSKIGARLCHRIDGTARRILDDGRTYPRKPLRRFSVWITADAAKVPIKIKGDTDIGYIEATISSHRPAKRRLVLRAPRL